jgi:hypothetical protein
VKRAISRLALSAGLVGTLLWVCSRLPDFDHATVALLLVVAIVGLATMWGWAEALTDAIIGGIGFDYYFLPPDGFGIASPAHWVALTAFLFTAAATGHLTVRLKRRRIEAEERMNEMQKLYRLSTAMLSGGPEFSLSDLASHLVEIFEVEGVALYDQQTARIIRSGPCSSIFSDQALRNTTTTGRKFEAASRTCFLTEIRHGEDLVGSIGMSGTGLSEPVILSVAQRVGLGLAKLHAIEKTTEPATRVSDRIRSLGHIESPVDALRSCRDCEGGQLPRSRIRANGVNAMPISSRFCHRGYRREDIKSDLVRQMQGRAAKA